MIRFADGKQEFVCSRCTGTYPVSMWIRINGSDVCKLCWDGLGGQLV